MAASLYAPAFAAETALTGSLTAADKGEVLIKGLAGADKVTFYQIVKATYSNGFKGYKAVDPSTGNLTDTKLFDAKGDPIYPSAAEAAALSKSDLSKLAKVEAAVSGDQAKTKLAMGTWLALVDSSQGYVYNPMVVSAAYKEKDGTYLTSGGEFDADSKYTIAGTTAFAKRSHTSLSKQISLVPDKDKAALTGSFTTLSAGDHMTYTISATIPAMSDGYKKRYFKIKDKMTGGLTLTDVSKIIVQVAGKSVASDNYTVTSNGATGKADTEFEISFKDGYLKSLEGADQNARAVTVSYGVKLSKTNLNINYDANLNTARITYPKNLSGDEAYQEDEVRVYTFGIDGKLSKSNGHRNRELVKTDEFGGVEVKEAAAGSIADYTVKSSLAGAIFELTLTADKSGKAISEETRNANEDKYTYYAVSDADGLFAGASDGATYRGHKIDGFNGLSEGTYTLKEVKAPAGYALDDQVHTVVISAKSGSAASGSATGSASGASAANASSGQASGNDILTSYTVKIDDAVSTYKFEAFNEAGEAEKISANPETSVIVKNTKLHALPSTGGKGIRLMTGAGAALAVVAVILFALKSRREA
ncbi:MAG: isopeptide-forming domain-containing fimbrial protein [Eubacteriales bacterium]|nr:isopeptide-forming domain-containing fimbrial protein [Eubacteriales bacterium]